MANINDWLQISQDSGNSGQTIVTVIASSYEELVERTASLKVSGVTKDATLSVLQNAFVPYLTVTPISHLFKSEGGSLTVNVSSNYSWSVLSEADWISLSKSSGKGDSTVVITASEYTEEEATREATINFYIASTVYASVSISQSTVEVLLATNLIEFPNDGGTKTIDVSSNIDWEVTSCPSWVSLSQTSGSGNATIVATVQEQTTEGLTKEDTIVFSGGSKTASTIARQEMKPYSPLPIDNYKIYYRTTNRAKLNPTMKYYYMEGYVSNTWNESLGCWELTFDKPITHIPKNFMRDQSVLLEISIPSSVVSIDEYAFYMCTNLEKVYYDTTNSSLMYIGYCSLNYCRNLKMFGNTLNVAEMPSKLLLLHGCAFATHSDYITSAIFHSNPLNFLYASFTDNLRLTDIYFKGSKYPYFAPPTGGEWTAEVFSNDYIERVYAPIGSDYSSISGSMPNRRDWFSINYNGEAEEEFASDVLYVENSFIGIKATGEGGQYIFVYNPNTASTLTASSSTFSNMKLTKLDITSDCDFGNWQIYELSVDFNSTEQNIDGSITITDGTTNITIPATQYKMTVGYLYGGMRKKINVGSYSTTEGFSSHNIRSWSSKIEKSKSYITVYGLLQGNDTIYLKYGSLPTGTTYDATYTLIGTDYFGNEYEIDFTVYNTK